MPKRHREQHKLENMGWMRAAVLGANDGIVSASSLILGVTASNASHHSILVTGIAGLVAGAMSMATGEYVSVHSQADTERAAIERERLEIEEDSAAEYHELSAIYIARGLEPTLAKQVASQLMAHDALGAHARDELGITEMLSAKPLQAALASACSFAAGALLPLLVAVFIPSNNLIPSVAGCALVFLAFLGGVAAKVGGADMTKGMMRITFWSALAMGVTASIGAVVGAVK